MRILAIDPGNRESAYVIFNGEKVIAKGKGANRIVEQALFMRRGIDVVLIEMVASYGMPVGADVFETCVQIGRFQRILEAGKDVHLVYRKDVKHHHCGTSKAKDSNIRQALVDKYAKGASNYGKGTKAKPGFFYGFRADIWQAFAIAAYWHETHQPAKA